jgi:hypothetical protein
MNLVNQSDGSIPQILITKNMGKKVFNYFARITSDVEKMLEIMLKT